MKPYRWTGLREHISGVSRMWTHSCEVTAADLNCARLDALRQQMLAVLGEAARAQDPVLYARIRTASAEALWHLRPRLLATLSQRDGELRAHQRLAEINTLFDGLVPAALSHSAGPPRH
jgi:hypothetical protein